MPSTIRQHIEKAFLRREGLLRELSEKKTNVYRLFTGESEGVDGVVVDIYRDFAVLQVFEGHFRGSPKELLELAESVLAVTSVKGVYAKRFLSDRSNAQPDDQLTQSTPFVGEPAPLEFEVLESGLRYWVRLYDGFSTGLFADQRDSRRTLAGISQGKRVLNLFSYTCAFSVSCAAAGAESVMSVDISKKVLQWGTRNAQLNGISLEHFRYRESDAVSFLQKAVEKGEQWDLVLVDPPSFSRSKHGTFSMEKDFKNLVALASSVIASGGFGYFSSNFAQWSQSDFERRVLESTQHPRQWKKMSIAGMPADYDCPDFTVNRILVKRN